MQKLIHGASKKLQWKQVLYVNLSIQTCNQTFT